MKVIYNSLLSANRAPIIMILIFALLFSQTNYAQKEQQPIYLGVNAATAFMTQIEAVCEKPTEKNLSWQISGGYVFNAPYGSFNKMGTNKDLTKRAGAFVRIGIKKYLQHETISPFLGLSMVNSIAYEEGKAYVPYCPDSYYYAQTFSKLHQTSYNLGIASSVGITCKPIKRILVDLGLQCGGLLINNLADYNSYTPGMGINFDPLRAQFIFEIKYQLNKKHN